MSQSSWGKAFITSSGCDKVKETCPVLPGAVWYYEWGLEDPASAKGSRTERMTVFRRVRDEIEGRVLDFIAKES